MRHALFVAFHFPPEASSSGVLRTAKYVRYLPERGYRISVVTADASAYDVTDASLDQRFAGSESIVMSGVRSLVAAPLLDSEGCLGMIALSARGHLRPFGEEDMELLVALAAAAALRIRNLALTEETARRRLLDKELDLARDRTAP